MNKEIKYWKWKNTIIDFDNLSNEYVEYNDYDTKKEYVFHYLGIPDKEIHEWWNGGYSCEYNEALKYAKQLELVEDYINVEDKLYDLQQRIDKALEYMKHYIEVEENDAVICEFKEVLEILKGDSND